MQTHKESKMNMDNMREYLDKIISLEQEQPVEEGAVKDMIQDVEEGMGKEEFEKKYPGQNYDEIRQEIEDRMNEAKKAPLTSELLQKGYDQVYNFVGEYGDAALEYLDDNAPTFNNLFTEYDGDLDVIASKVDMTTFNQIMDELNDVAFDLESGVLESKTEEQELDEFKSLIGRTGGVMGFKN